MYCTSALLLKVG